MVLISILSYTMSQWRVMHLSGTCHRRGGWNSPRYAHVSRQQLQMSLITICKQAVEVWEYCFTFMRLELLRNQVITTHFNSALLPWRGALQFRPTSYLVCPIMGSNPWKALMLSIFSGYIQSKLRYENRTACCYQIRCLSTLFFIDVL